MTDFILPTIVLLIIIYSAKKINVYDAFIEGTKESFAIILEIFPCLLSMILAVNILNNSQILSNFSDNANILSMIISATLKEGDNAQREIIKTYNYNLSSNEKLTINEVLEYRNLSSNYVQSEILKTSEKYDNLFEELDRLEEQLEKVRANCK